MTDSKTPLVIEYEAIVPACAAGADDAQTVAETDFAATVTSVEYIADTAITGADTNSRDVSLINKGQAGAGSTVIAHLHFVSGVDAVAFDATPITLSGTAADLVVADGDVLAWASDHVGTGLADPGGTVKVEVTRS